MKNYTVEKRSSGPGRMWGVEGLSYSRKECDEALVWIDQTIPGTLVENDFRKFVFNSIDAAIRFKLVWG